MTSPDSRPVSVTAVPKIHTSSKSQVGISDSARSCPRSASTSTNRPPMPPISANDARAKVAASRGSTAETATSVSWATTHTVVSIRIRP